MINMILVSSARGFICKQTTYIQSLTEFTALQGAINDLTNLTKQGFEKMRIFKLNKYT